jgi:hypothetical protein
MRVTLEGSLTSDSTYMPIPDSDKDVMPES